MSRKNDPADFPNVGISQIEVALPEHFIFAEEIAKARGLPPGYASKGLGCCQARIPSKITIEELAVEAVQKIDDYNEVERFLFATESDYNLSRPMAIDVINGRLGLSAVPIQNKFACLAALQALIEACEYSVAHKGKPAIVIAADSSIYRDLDPHAEVTIGSAAVAMRVEMSPDLLALDYLNYGQWGRPILDFGISASGVPFPQVDGPLSKPALLICVKGALTDWLRKNPEFESMVDKLTYFVLSIVDKLAQFALHTPFPKMVEWAMAMFWHHVTHKEQDEEERISLEDCIKDPNLYPEYKKIIDFIRKEDPDFPSFFKNKVEPGLQYNPFIGNPYTAAILISLMGALKEMKKDQEIGMMGYGSGSGSYAIRGRAMKSGFKGDLDRQIKEGIQINFEEYEDWRKETLKNIWGDFSTTIDVWKEMLPPEELKSMLLSKL